MKKIIALLMVTVLICSAFTACAPKDPEENTAPPVENTTEPDSKLPEYVPGSVRLTDEFEDDKFYDRRFRMVYYKISEPFWDLIEDEDKRNAEADWFAEASDRSGFTEAQFEMSLVTFIKRNHITREQFDSAVAKMEKPHADPQTGVIPEEDELPNGDILYTLDNVIINRYYRFA